MGTDSSRLPHRGRGTESSQILISNPGLPLTQAWLLCAQAPKILSSLHVNNIPRFALAAYQGLGTKHAGLPHWTPTTPGVAHSYMGKPKSINVPEATQLERGKAGIQT